MSHIQMKVHIHVEDSNYIFFFFFIFILKILTYLLRLLHIYIEDSNFIVFVFCFSWHHPIRAWLPKQNLPSFRRGLQTYSCQVQTPHWAILCQHYRLYIAQSNSNQRHPRHGYQPTGSSEPKPGQLLHQLVPYYLQEHHAGQSGQPVHGRLHPVSEQSDEQHQPVWQTRPDGHAESHPHVEEHAGSLQQYPIHDDQDEGGRPNVRPELEQMWKLGREDELVYLVLDRFQH